MILREIPIFSLSLSLSEGEDWHENLAVFHFLYCFYEADDKTL